MSNQLDYCINKQNDKSVSIQLTGFIDETTREVLFRLKGEIPDNFGTLAIDTSGVSRISSIGIAHYSAFIKSFKDVRIKYQACSVVFMDFLSMLPGVKGEAEIESFYGSYFCERCDDEFSVLVRIEDVHISHTASCTKCAGTSAAIGYIEEKIKGY